MQKIGYQILFMAIILLVSCQSKPKVIEAQKSINSSPTQNEMQNTNIAGHTVVVKEVLQASKYTYANVEEDGKTFWIAVPKSEVEVGVTYTYTGGLKKTNFESRDFDRTFESIYLVPGLSKSGNTEENTVAANVFAGVESTVPSEQVKPQEGSISLSELFSNKSKYQGKTVQVTGKCVKVNNQIMGRNWLHIQDGTKKGAENYDLTITTDELIEVGSTITMEGVITLDKDFGAGYRYDVIMESAKPK